MKSVRHFAALILGIATFFGPSRPARAEKPHKTENVIFVMSDGLRWQEVFGGAEKRLLDAPGVANQAALKREFWRDNLEARREALMPFLWKVVAKQGQLYGNRHKGSDAYVTNGLNFSYPGYQEILCGFHDPRVNSNGYGPSPDVTVLEWLNAKPAYHGHVAAFGAWSAFDRIFNKDRCGFLVNSAYAPLTEGLSSPTIKLLNSLKRELPRVWADEVFDALEFHTALEYFKLNRPRVMYVMLGETDDWAHAGKYDEYLTSIHRADEYLHELWDAAQSMPQYKDKTSIIFSVDHGRGDGPTDWKGHGEPIKASKYIWMGYLGPDTPPLGERSNIKPVTQSQVAATLAALLGEDYASATPKAGKPIADVLGKP